MGLEIIELNGFHAVPPGAPLGSMGHLEGAVELVEGQKCRWVYRLQQLHLNLLSNWGIEFYCLKTTNLALSLKCKWKNRTREENIFPGE